MAVNEEQSYRVQLLKDLSQEIAGLADEFEQIKQPFPEEPISPNVPDVLLTLLKLPTLTRQFRQGQRQAAYTGQQAQHLAALQAQLAGVEEQRGVQQALAGEEAAAWGREPSEVDLASMLSQAGLRGKEIVPGVPSRSETEGLAPSLASFAAAAMRERAASLEAENRRVAEEEMGVYPFVPLKWRETYAAGIETAKPIVDRALKRNDDIFNMFREPMSTALGFTPSAMLLFRASRQTEAEAISKLLGEPSLAIENYIQQNEAGEYTYAGNEENFRKWEQAVHNYSAKTGLNSLIQWDVDKAEAYAMTSELPKEGMPGLDAFVQTTGAEVVDAHIERWRQDLQQGITAGGPETAAPPEQEVSEEGKAWEEKIRSQALEEAAKRNVGPEEEPFVSAINIQLLDPLRDYARSRGWTAMEAEEKFNTYLGILAGNLLSARMDDAGQITSGGPGTPLFTSLGQVFDYLMHEESGLLRTRSNLWEEWLKIREQGVKEAGRIAESKNISDWLKYGGVP